MTMEALLAKIWEILTIYGLKILAALAILLIGRWVAKAITKVLKRVMESRQVDPTLTTFVFSLTYYGLLAFVIIAALGQLGVQTASFIAVLGAAGLAVGLALQGSLSNFAAGVLMIIFRPFQVGDYIEGSSVAGTVEALQIFTTQIRTPDNKVIIIPNAKLTSGNIINYSKKDTRRVDLVMGIGYGDDIDKARTVMTETLAADSRILSDPAPQIAVLELGDSAVKFVVRPWVKTDDYWPVYFDLTENLKKRFDAAEISIPYPQRDVHVYEHNL